MSLAHTILGLLTYEPKTGYDLKSFFDNSINFFWPASLSQIYRDLAALEDKGYVSHHIEPQEGRPDKKVYSITEDGRQVFQKWLHRFPATLSPTIRDQFAVRIFFGSQLSDDELRFQLTRFLKETLNELNSTAYVTGVVEKYCLFRPEDKLYWDILIKRHRMMLEAMVRWAEESIKEINARCSNSTPDDIL